MLSLIWSVSATVYNMDETAIYIFFSVKGKKKYEKETATFIRTSQWSMTYDNSIRNNYKKSKSQVV